ncbi:N-methylhydantoinase B [Aquamicrobium terrae]
MTQETVRPDSGAATDPILLAIIQRQLDHITTQMGTVMSRTARSPIFSQSHDFTCFLSNARGETIAQADGLPIHSGGGGFAVRAVLRDYGDDIHPGDVFILSDPYEAGGNHLPDWTMIRPVFLAGALAGFCTNRAHQSDIGGGAPGSYNAAATEIFHEGIRLPVMRLFEKDRRRRDLWKLLLLNSRCPDLLDGDLEAMVGSTRIGAERLQALLEQIGADSADHYIDALLAYAEGRMRQAIRALPDGEWHGRDFSDNDCFGPAEIETRLRLTVAGDTMTFDFTGTSPQVKGFKNSSLANTYSSVYVALSAFMDRTIPRNEGTYRSVRIIAPQGTIVNAVAPAPMTMNTIFPAIDIMNACWDALGKVEPDSACAGWGKPSHPISSGVNADGHVYVMYHWHAHSGGGAVKGRDGFGTISPQMTLGGMAIPNVESYEHSYPLTVRRHEYACDGGGPGEYRGGCGVDYVADLHTPSQILLRGEGLLRETGMGVAGGAAGRKGELEVHTLAGSEAVGLPQYGVYRLEPMRIELRSPGGGGWGDPRQRDREAVRRDLRDGIVSPEAARDVYGLDS